MSDISYLCIRNLGETITIFFCKVVLFKYKLLSVNLSNVLKALFGLAVQSLTNQIDGGLNEKKD